jgi:transcriptional regulator with XRE-family HTH domain
METTLGERVKLAMKGPPKVLGKDLAKACGVSAASVSDWRNGETQTIEGLNLIKAAEFLGVRAKWLAEGTGPIREDVSQDHKVMAPAGQYVFSSKFDSLTSELVQLFERLDKNHKHEFLGRLRGFVEGLDAHGKDPPLGRIPPANNGRTGTHS